MGTGAPAPVARALIEHGQHQPGHGHRQRMRPAGAYMQQAEHQCGRQQRPCPRVRRTPHQPLLHAGAHDHLLQHGG
ncbi:conserved hypothetical protein [Ricinus communis]|uniref:Uncharacterized protein n=1 Tax=Ricinus communis TaxID=3988 RepID=B9TPZ6_RICCO|nr:conserved hypothetical protein [Ricinus communis]